MRISDWNSDVCSSDLGERESAIHFKLGDDASRKGARIVHRHKGSQFSTFKRFTNTGRTIRGDDGQATDQGFVQGIAGPRSEEHTSELQSLMRISYAVFCLKKKKKNKRQNTQLITNKQH